MITSISYFKRNCWSKNLAIWLTEIVFDCRLRTKALPHKRKNPLSWPYLIGEKKSGKNFIGEKCSHFWKISHFFPTKFSNSSPLPDQFLKLKGLSWVGLLFWYFLSLGFFKQSVEKCTVGVTNRFVDITYFFYFYLIIIIHFTIMKWYNI